MQISPRLRADAAFGANGLFAATVIAS